MSPFAVTNRRLLQALENYVADNGDELYDIGYTVWLEAISLEIKNFAIAIDRNGQACKFHYIIKDWISPEPLSLFSVAYDHRSWINHEIKARLHNVIDPFIDQTRRDLTSRIRWSAHLPRSLVPEFRRTPRVRNALAYFKHLCVALDYNLDNIVDDFFDDLCTKIFFELRELSKPRAPQAAAFAQ